MEGYIEPTETPGVGVEVNRQVFGKKYELKL